MFASLSRVVVACLLLLSLGGCANYIFRSFDIDSGESLSLDAKQRLVLATYKGGKSGNRKIVCAEPSPDAFSATSASAAASTAFTFPTLLPGGQTGTDGGQPGTSGSGGIAAARSESAASIGMRTQTIQLLRDGLYRACEAYMNGAIDQHQYNIVLLNIDKLMITLLGVDAIGTIQSRDQNLGGVASDTKEIQADALTDILFAANAQSSAPALCISLLASGELRLDNPGQQALLVRCDYLLAGTFEHLVRQREGAAARDGALAALKAPLPNKTSIGAGEQSASHIGTWTTSTALMNAEQHESVAAWRAWDQWTVQFP